jgi:ribosomal protein S12 methylthiotransferase accessory factor
MDIRINFPGGVCVNAEFPTYTVTTDQPVAKGGSGSAPTPFNLFLSAIGTCAGFYVVSFCQQRGIPVDGIQIIEHVHTNPETHMTERIDLEIQVPPTFPAKYYDSLVRAAQLCSVKKHLEQPPTIDVFTRVVDKTLQDLN